MTPFLVATALRQRRRIVGLAVPGVVPTAPAIAQSIQYHPNTAALTMRADSTFSGYIVPITGADAARLSMLVVTAHSYTTSQGLKYSIVLTGGGAALGTMILSPKEDEAGQTGAGSTGRYLVTGGNQTVGSAGSPVVFTAAAQQVVGMSDLKGRANLSSADNKGPELKTDAYGRKYLHFTGDNVFEWLRNLTVTGLDTHNIAWFLVGRFPTTGKTTQGLGNNTIVSTGANEVGSVPAQTTALGASLNFPTTAWGGVSTSTPIATAKRMILGSQMQVVGSSTSTTDGVGGATTTGTARVWLNETSVSQSSVPARGNNVTGLTINSRAAGAGPNNTVTFDLYELNGYILGELGTPATSQARGDTIVASIMSNYGVLPIARSIVLMGDSRTEYGQNVVNGTGNEATGITLSSVLSDPGPGALPADVRVVGWGAGGEGVGYMSGYLEQTFSNFATAPCPLQTSWMLGGGNDYFAMLSGGNDTGVPETGGGKWPSNNGPLLGGNFVAGSASLINEMYNGGAAYTTTFTATVSANSTSVAATGISPSFIYDGMTFAGTGWSPGAMAYGYYTASPFILAFPQATALSAVATTGTLSSYQAVIGKLLARGFKGLWFAEWPSISPTFRTKVITSALADALAGSGQTYDGKLRIIDSSLISVAGSFPFGANFKGYGNYNIDLIHMNTFGKKLIIGGGDTPLNGYLANIKALMGVS